MHSQRPDRPVAHTPRSGSDDWDYLTDHLGDVASMAAEFAKAFDAEGIAFLAGLWHDLGKFNPKFQDYLWACYLAQRQGVKTPKGKKTPHAIWGGAFAYDQLKERGIERWQDLSLAIQGHHTRLSDQGTGEGALLQFAQSHSDAMRLMWQAAGEIGTRVGGLPSPRFPAVTKLEQELFIRMLFSALVDADHLKTEEHFHPDDYAARFQSPNLEALWGSFKTNHRGKRDDGTTLTRIRGEVYAACLDAALHPPGLFRLTVPTGGGKTLSGLGFALQHAIKNNLRQIIVALPYTSIIDQTARVYRDILGEDAVLEHHSALEVPATEDEDETAVRLRLATQNWDAPLVVTTTVQLFESLFANTPSKVRKLHRLAKSVIILDEIQALPPELLLPTLDAINALTTPVEQGGYGATVVLCTATQPTFEVSPLSDLVNESIFHQIVPQYAEHFAQLKRVTYEWRDEPLTWTELADEIRPLPQVLVVLNTRKDALAMLDILRDTPNVFHLSTLLCGAHRRKILARVRELLAQGQPVHLISTQVIECGVDVSFPVVYRALGPLDRVVQVAGRCNRNFELTEGRVVVFEAAEGSAPAGPYMIGIEKAKLVMHGRSVDDLHDPELYRTYFRRLYQDVKLDERDIQSYREQLNFPEVAKRYHLISKETVPVVVSYTDESDVRLNDWQAAPTRRSWQRLQPYIVNLYQHELRKYDRHLKAVSANVYQWLGDYDSERHHGIVASLSDPCDLLPGQLVV